MARTNLGKTHGRKRNKLKRGETVKVLKKFISVTLALILIVSAAFTVNAYKASYNTKGLVYATPVEDQKASEDCIYYALLSAAGTYCIKNNNLPREEANFNEKALKSKIGKTTNFGEVIYSSVGFDIGHSNYITNVESLPVSRAENRAIKKKINENGAVCAAVYLPESGMGDTKYYSDKNYTFNCPSEEIGTAAHAFAIVGYDDRFSADNFICKPYSPGAWVCKNSYGLSYGKEGYFYLPYEYPLLYAASVEVTQLQSIHKVKRASDSLFNFRYIGAFGFKTASASDNSHILIKVDDEIIYEDYINIVKGYNTIPVASPFYYGEVELTVNGERINNKSVYLYYLKTGNSSVEFSKPSEIANWTQRAEKLSITIRPDNKVSAYAKVADGDNPENTVNLPMPHLLKDKGNVIIIPASGIYFDENTVVNYNMKDFNDKYHTIDDIPFSEFTDKESRYANLLTDGRVKALNLNIQGAFVKGIDIATDDKSDIVSAKLIFDENTNEIIDAKDLNIKKFKNNTGAFSIEYPGEETRETARLDSYFATLEVDGYYITSDFRIYLNGKPADNSAEYIQNEGASGLKIGIVIDIPDVKDLLDVFSGFLLAIVKMLSLFR